MPYAKNTTVSPEKSQIEIQTTLRRYGATGFAFAQGPDQIRFAFDLKERRIQITLTMPTQAPDRTPTGKRRSAGSAQEALRQEIRRRWRALALTIKAKLEAVESGIETFDQAFMPYLLLPNGRTVGESLLPGLEDALATGHMPLLLSTG